MQLSLNMPDKLSDVFVADITRCYETIPLEGPDNLVDALVFVIKIGFKEAQLLHPRSVTYLWAHISAEGVPDKATWHTRKPSSGIWVKISQERLINMHTWLIRHCFVSLGDRVWRQTTGIPMGFPCSPLWCNTYLLTYEVKFTQRLARLGCTDLMAKFLYPHCYIDDICWFNVGNPQAFLCPTQPYTEENPFWIYPLQVLEIKPKITAYDLADSTRGVATHFMNMQITILDDDKGLYSMRKFDKRRDLPFGYSQFIHFASNRLVKQSYNIIMSQVLPILYISNSAEAAATEINLLIDTMVGNGFQDYRLRYKICCWLQAGHFPGLKVNITDTITLITR
jgi:hypothetical protein